MIGGFRDKRTRSFAAGQRVKAFDGIARKLSAKLDQLDAATSLRGIRVNDQWRVCFEWPKGAKGPVNVEVVDYH